MQEIKKRGLTLMFLLVLTLSHFSLLSIASAEDEWSETWEITYGEDEPQVTPLSDQERDACPMNRTGLIYNSYSVFTYFKGDNPDGIIRFSDTVNYFNTVNEDVTFTFQTTPFHETRSHTIPLPMEISKDFIFTPIPKNFEYIDLPEKLVVPSMHKGELILKIELSEEDAYAMANNSGLIGLVSGTPSVDTDISGMRVTSVPAYKIFIVLMSEDNIVETQGVGKGIDDDDDGSMWMLYAIGIIAIVCVAIFFIVRSLEIVEVEDE